MRTPFAARCLAPGGAAVVLLAVTACGTAATAVPASSVAPAAAAQASCTVGTWAEEFTHAGHLAWQVSLPVNGGLSVPFSPVQPLADGAVSVFPDGNVLYALRLRDGHQAWKKVFPEAKNSYPGVVYGLWQWHGSAVALLGAGSSAPQLVALNAATGAVRWSLRLGARELAGTQALTSDGVLAVLTVSGRLEAASLTTGKLLWAREYGESAGPLAVGTTVIATKPFGPLATVTRTVAGFDARTGKVLWSRHGLPDTTSVAAAPGGRVLLYDAAPPPLTLNPKPAPVIALSAATGRTLWQLNTAKPVTAAWADSAGVVIATGLQGTVYVQDPTARLYLADLATGKVRWSAGGTHADPYTTPLITTTDVVYVATTPATGTVIDRKLSTGAVRWKAVISDVYGRFLDRPSGPEVLVTFPVAAHTSRLLAIDASTGKTRATVNLPARVSAPPTVTGSRILMQPATPTCVPPVAP